MVMSELTYPGQSWVELLLDETQLSLTTEGEIPIFVVSPAPIVLTLQANKDLGVVYATWTDASLRAFPIGYELTSPSTILIECPTVGSVSGVGVLMVEAYDKVGHLATMQFPVSILSVPYVAPTVTALFDVVLTAEPVLTVSLTAGPA